MTDDALATSPHTGQPAADAHLWIEFEREASRLQGVLSELSVIDRRELRDAFAIIAQAAADALAVGRVSLWRYQESRLAMVCAAAWHRGAMVEDHTVISARTHPTYWAALHGGRTLPIADALHDPALVEFRDEYVRPLDIGAMLDSSIRVEGDTCGIVCVEHLGSSRLWTALERTFVASLGDRLGLVVLLDEQRRLENALAQAHKMEALGLMAGGLAHDFNNVISIVLNSAELAQAAVDDGDDPSEDLAVIRNAATRAAGMTRRLLTIARRESMAFEAIELNSIVNDFGPIAKRLMPPNVHLQLALPPCEVVVSADRAFVDQALLNLVTNAAQAMPAGGTLTIEVALDSHQHPHTFGEPLPRGPLVRLTVRDTGEGIDGAVLPRVFDPFFTTKHAAGGTGLGLAVVYGGMRQHGGAVAVASTPKVGSAFSLLFPPASELPRH